jgi:hypothetical protein
MAYVSAAEGYAAAASVIHGDLAHPNVINISDVEMLATGHFHRAGPDLILTGHNGRQYVIPEYFSSDHPPALVGPNSAGLPGDLVTLLAGSVAPAEYAQAQPQTQPTASPGSIGQVEKVIGDASVIRNGVAVTLHVGDVVYQSDVIETGTNSRVGIGFPDGTALELTANTRMALSEYSYNANSTSNSALLTLVDGTFAFVAGKVAHTGDMKISTPVATMGIRGTTGYVLEADNNYQFVVVDDYASTRHGAYDLYEIDQNGNLVRDQNGLPIIMATVSQTEYITECSLTSCTTTPMSAAQFAFAQQIVPQLFQTYILNNPTAPHTNPGGTGSSEPLFQPNGPQNPQLNQNNGTPNNSNGPSDNAGPTGGPSQPILDIITPPPPPPPVIQPAAFPADSLVEYYFFPGFGADYFTSATFTPPSSGIEGNPDEGGLFFLSVSGNSITASHFAFDGTFTVAPFNGFEVLDLTGNPEISGVTIDAGSNMAGLTSSDVFFESNAIWVNWEGLTFNPNTIVKLDVTFDPPLEQSQVSVAQTLDGSTSPATNAGTLAVVDGTELQLTGTIDNTGSIVVNGTNAATAIGVDGTVILQGGGHIVLSDSDQNYIFGHGTLLNMDNTISGSGDIGNGSLIFHNEGIVEALGPYALIIDTGANPFINTGIIETNSGTLIVDSPVAGSGNAIIAGGTLEFTGASDNNVAFSGNNVDILALDQSQQFSGHISGFGGADQIDLGDIAFSSTTTLSYAADANGSGGLLTVSDGTHTSVLDFIGNYTDASFVASSDGHGGTLLNDAAGTMANSGSSPITSADVVDGSIETATTAGDTPITASYTPDSSNYIGSFALEPVSESSGNASVGWQFSVADDQINLGSGQTVTQSYDVSLDAAGQTIGNQTVAVSIGGAGNDNFIFQPGIGADTIVNFNAQQDTVELDHFSNAQTVQELQSLITSDAHGDAVIDLGHGDSITMQGVSAAQLQAVLQSAFHLH